MLGRVPQPVNDRVRSPIKQDGGGFTIDPTTRANTGVDGSGIGGTFCAVSIGMAGIDSKREKEQLEMTSKSGPEDFDEAKRRLAEISGKLGSLFGGSAGQSKGSPIAGNFLSGLGTLVEQIGELARKAERAGGEMSERGEFETGSGKRGVFGFSVKMGLGEKTAEIEPFGNIRKDEESGRIQVREIREPLLDVFDEADHVLIVAEVPGIMKEDLRLELHDDVLTIAAERGEAKYRKEVLLPESFSQEKMSFTCRNGILKIKLVKA